jgi:tetratricopeptide (TPR) repeat protein
MRYTTVVLASSLALVLALSPTPATADLTADAVSAYDRGQYREAAVLLEQIDAAGDADGPLLYRLAYCQRQSADARAGKTQDRAREALEIALGSATDLEFPFYLANTYDNLGRKEDALRIAAEATAGVEQGDMTRPSTGSGSFQLGKLYADQGLDEKAAEWYTKAIEILAEEGDRGGPYVRWASRFLAERAFRARDFESAEEYYTVLTEAGAGEQADFDHLAVSRVHLAQYRAAANAWKQAALLKPADADRARYCASLAKLASRLDALPEQAPSGKGWDEFSKDELQALLSDLADQAKQTRTEVTEGAPLSDEDRVRLSARFEEIQPVFVAAALEYAMRGHSIREAAFFGGYAPLIFRAKDWRVPGEPGQKKKKKKKKKTAANP